MGESSNLFRRQWPSPAKLNLFLHVVGQRTDGYHELQTLFQLIDFCDCLSFSPCDAATGQAPLRLANEIPGVPTQSNLVMRAGNLLLPYRRKRIPIEISIQKTIPMGAGLGGGSSNAATTLVALNQIWDCGCTQDQLAEMGLSLGADVPVFVRGQSALAEGVGEELLPVWLEKQHGERWYLLICPDCPVSTVDVFAAEQLCRSTPRWSSQQLIASSLEETRNDCEPVVVEQYPKVKQALAALSEFGFARMTGTGSTVFSVFDSKEAAQAVSDQMTGPWRSFVARGLDQSPLFSGASI